MEPQELEPQESVQGEGLDWGSCSCGKWRTWVGAPAPAPGSGETSGMMQLEEKVIYELQVLQICSLTNPSGWT